MAKIKSHPRTGGPTEKALNGVCLASAHIMTEGKKVGYMYREEPEEDLDSGWRFLSGEEDDSYLDIDDNYGVFDVDAVVKVDALVRNYIHLPIGTELERDGGKFVIIVE
jgi:hypothetical protein